MSILPCCLQLTCQLLMKVAQKLIVVWQGRKVGLRAAPTTAPSIHITNQTSKSNTTALAKSSSNNKKLPFRKRKMVSWQGRLNHRSSMSGSWNETIHSCILCQATTISRRRTLLYCQFSKRTEPHGIKLWGTKRNTPSSIELRIIILGWWHLLIGAKLMRALPRIRKSDFLQIIGVVPLLKKTST